MLLLCLGSTFCLCQTCASPYTRAMKMRNPLVANATKSNTNQPVRRMADRAIVSALFRHKRACADALTLRLKSRCDARPGKNKTSDFNTRSVDCNERIGIVHHRCEH